MHLKLDLSIPRPFRNRNTTQLHHRFHPQTHNLNHYRQTYCVKSYNIYILLLTIYPTLECIAKYTVLKHVTYTSRILLTYKFFIRVVIIITIIMMSSNCINKRKGIFYDSCYVKCKMFIWIIIILTNIITIIVLKKTKHKLSFNDVSSIKIYLKKRLLKVMSI